MAIDPAELKRLVDWEHGLISPRIFTDEGIYEAELERLFGRTWLFLAHESMLSKPGDFFTTFMGADGVIVVRQRDGGIGAFLNACRHRGMKVCRADLGNARAFTCTYHGWSYDTEGRLVSVPNFEDGYFGELEMNKWGLIPVAQVDTYKGLIFGCFDPTAPSLTDYLGDSTFYLDCYLDRREGGTEVLGGVHKWSFKGNWKMAAEQFAGDAYHVALSHASVMMTVADPGVLAGGSDPVAVLPKGLQYASRLGHGAGVFLEDGAPMIYPVPTITQYYDDTHDEMAQRLGRPRVGSHHTVFPNLSGLTGPFMTIRVWHPKGPNAFETWSWVLVDKAAPPELREEQRRFTTSQFSASGMTEQDDGENWSEIGRTLSTGVQIRKHSLNYQMGLGHEHDEDPDFPGRIGPIGIGDGPQRAFYRRWLEFLTTDSWPAVDDSQSTQLDMAHGL